MTFVHLLAFILISPSYGELTSDQFPGGSSTVLDWSKQAFNHPLANASSQLKREFGVGNSFFKEVWVQAPSTTEARDGLGPTFNAVACAACHVNDGRGMGFNHKDKVNLSLLFRLSVIEDKQLRPHPAYGDQFQPLSIDGVPGEGKVDVEFKILKGQYPDGETYELRYPVYSFKDLSFGSMKGVRVSPRVAPQVIGLGLLEAIAEDDILALEDPKDVNGDGISGRANWIYSLEDQTLQLGRFGWKANQVNLREQNAGAFSGDMGLTTSILPKQNCPLVQIECAQSVHGGEPEVSEKVLDRVTTYTQLIAVPKARNYESEEFKHGRKLFNQINCSVCHTPNFTTGTTHQYEALNNQSIWPYTDLLLHDMGMGLADHRPDGMASGREWKTPPLWGIGLIKTVNGHTNLLHDGRARNVEEAILWHGGEAATTTEKFKNLVRADRQALIYFVNSI